MNNLTIIRCESENNKPKIGLLNYGTFVTDVPSGSDCVYVKVKKHGCGEGVDVKYPRGKCVLLNIEYGTLRAINGDTPVTPLIPKLAVSPLPMNRINEVKK